MTTLSKEILKTTFKQDASITPETVRIVWDILEGRLDAKAIKQCREALQGSDSEKPLNGDPDRILKGVEAAKMLGIHPYTLRKWAKAGIIPSIRLNGSAKTLGYSLADVQAFINRNRGEVA